MINNGFASLMIGRLAQWTKKLAGATGGGAMITFAVALPVLLLAIGGAVDFGYMYVRQSSLQAAADAAALASAKELQLANADEDEIKEIAKAAVLGNLKEIAKGVTVDTQVSFGNRSVTVNASQRPGLYFLGGMAGIEEFDIAAHATARVAGDMPICMLVLEPSIQGALAVNKRARITGNECSVYSNSTSSSGIITKSDAYLESKLTCSTGGFIGEPYTYHPVPLTDCPPIEDPLASRPPPPVGACVATDLVIESGTHTLDPGTYCGGMILKDADITLNPGVYVIKDGVLWVGGSARLTGENVSFYISGAKANFNMLPNTSIELSAPKDGPMAGILFFEDRSNPVGRRNVIRSNDARSFVGTIYLSRGAFVVDASKPLFDQSAYTVVITRLMDMFSGPNLVLNSDYGSSDVPLPSELGSAPSPGDKIVLAK